ncbi:MAG: septum formation inhibitor Maf [Flaviaesturariibacter sp.]|nr:septum formation inhibitor Maf [Flaviaesturariibacter sp.]
MPSYVLASQSPRRKQLLEWAEIDFEIIVHPTDESYPPGLTPRAVAEHIANEKAAAVVPLAGGRTVIAADTIVVLETDIIGKPRDRADAVSILTRLAGREHEVITAVCLSNGKKHKLFSDLTKVRFHPISAASIEFYVDKYKPYDKAGAYAIQEWIGVVGIHSISGDFYNVMGLPVSRVVQALDEFG